MDRKRDRLAGRLRPVALLGGAAALVAAAALGPARAEGPAATPQPTPGAEAALRPKPPAVPDTDQGIVQELHAANRTAIEAGRIAIENGAADHVRDLGRLLVSDHSMADQRLQDLARNHGIALSDEIGLFSHEQKEELDRLRALHGPDFDRAFTRAVAADQQQAIALVEGARARTQSPDLRSLLERLTPILEQHRALAADVRDEVTATAAASWKWGDRYASNAAP